MTIRWMKRSVLVMLALLFTCAVQGAAAQTLTADVKGAQITPRSGNRAVVVRNNYGENSRDVYLVDGGRVIRTAWLSPIRIELSPVVAAHADPAFLVADRQSGTFGWVEWGEAGLEICREMELFSVLDVKPEGIVLSRDDPESMFAAYAFLDPDGSELFTLSGDNAIRRIDDFARDGDGWGLWAEAFRHGEIVREVQRIDNGGAEIWACEVAAPSQCDRILSDGQGGAWLPYMERYAGQVILPHVSASGKLDQIRTLDGQGTVIYLYESKPADNGGAVLYGTSVAKSRGIYHAFALTLDAQGNQTALDVRKFGYGQDYSFTLKKSADGTVYACSQGLEEYPPVLVPFEELERVETEYLHFSEHMPVYGVERLTGTNR